MSIAIVGFAPIFCYASHDTVPRRGGMLATNKSKAQLEAELKFLRRSKLGDQVAGILRQLIAWGFAVLIARYCFLSIVALAGLHTEAKIGVSLFGDLRISEALAWALAGSGTFYGWKQRKLRKSTVEELAAHNKKLEQQLDRKRSSSNLDSKGDTRKEDL